MGPDHEDKIELIAGGQAVAIIPASAPISSLRPDLTTVPLEGVEPGNVALATRAGDRGRLVTAFRGQGDARPRVNRELCVAVILNRKEGRLAMEPLAGDDPVEVAGYRLRARLGAGGMGRVYLAFTGGGRPVALKMIRPELGDDLDFRGRFRQEVAVARRVHGLYTAQVLDADPDASPPWLVTAYVAGPSLHQVVAEHGPMPAETVLLLLAGVAEALQAIHGAGIVHRDLKPSNVLLAADGPRVIDFGIARAAEATALTRTGIRVGSPQFMAPEQAEGMSVSPTTDVFALGSLAAYAAGGHPPFGEGTDAAMLYRIVHQAPDLDGCPPSLRGLIGRCLAKAPAERPSPAEIISECRRSTAGQTLQIAQAWLPPAVAVGLAQHAVPAAPATVTASTAGLGDSAPGTLIGQPGEPWHEVRRPFSRKALIVGAAALILAAGVGAGLLALLAPGGARGSSGHGTAAGTSAGAAAGSRHPVTVRRSQAASARPSPPNPAACLVGTWKMTVEDLLNTINGEQVQFSGVGPTVIFRQNGTEVNEYGNDTMLSADINGVEWTDTLAGSATSHWVAQNGQLLFSGISAHGTWTLREDGEYNNSDVLSIEPGADPYKCSGNSLRVYYPNGSGELTRKTAPQPTHRPAGS